MLDQFMPYIFPYGAAVGAIVLGAMGVALIKFGSMINDLPTKKGGDPRALGNPKNSTIIAVLAILIGYIVSVYALLSTEKLFVILGIAGVIAMFMFMATAYIFSAAVYNAIIKKNKELCVVST